MIADFSWQTVAEKMDRTYQWLTGRSEIPAWVTTG